jgi:hypothetical protein
LSRRAIRLDGAARGEEHAGEGEGGHESLVAPELTVVLSNALLIVLSLWIQVLPPIRDSGLSGFLDA